MDTQEFVTYVENVYLKANTGAINLNHACMDIEDIAFSFSRVCLAVNRPATAQDLAVVLISELMLFTFRRQSEVIDCREFYRQLIDYNMDILRRKNADYSGSDANPFRNFESVSKFGITTTACGILVRCCDKLSRMQNLVKNGTPAVVDESLTDTMMDMMNYVAILSAYMEAENE